MARQPFVQRVEYGQKCQLFRAIVVAGVLTVLQSLRVPLQRIQHALALEFDPGGDSIAQYQDRPHQIGQPQHAEEPESGQRKVEAALHGGIFLQHGPCQHDPAINDTPQNISTAGNASAAYCSARKMSMRTVRAQCSRNRSSAATGVVSWAKITIETG